ncbi:MAG TPA: ABC transporter substrate-binding protein [Alphaproteobacteria bacterium]
MRYCQIFRRAALACVVVLGPLGIVGGAQADDKAIFQTNWRAQAEHGGFYQALATGLYKKYGLDAEVHMGGPQMDVNALLLAGKVDFVMSNALAGFNYVRENLPFIVVASSFQKDPQVLISHPGVGNDALADLKGKPIMIGAAGRTSYWPFLRAKFGYTDDQIRPYTFNLAPFLADKNAIQQGFVTSEVFAVQLAGVKPVVHLFADAGYDNYQTTINTSRENVEKRADYVQRFVNASIEGWKSYIFGDPAPANAMIKADNPEMTDEKIAYAIQAMRDSGIVDSGDSKTLGIGAMTDERWERFFKLMSGAGVYPPDLDYKKGYTLQFVNKRVGM